MPNLNRLYFNILDVELIMSDGMELECGRTRIGMFLESIVVVLPHDVQYALHTVDVHRFLSPEIDRPNIVQPGQVIFVLVREKHGIHVCNSLTQKLLTEIRTGINEQVHTINLHESGGAQTVVARIRRTADLALATHHRNAL